MASHKFQISIYLIICSSVCFCDYYRPEDSLRQNITKLFKGQLNISRDSSLPSYTDDLVDHTPENLSEYDFIVIGAGTAGATIASRLSEIEKATVLLIEAGSKEYPIMDIPFVAGALKQTDQVRWNYETIKSSTYCTGFKDSKCEQPCGKVMGGSSVLNLMLATRANEKDYDRWAGETGDLSWSYKEMLKYFKKLENFQVKGIQFDREQHGFGGPVHITMSSYHTELSKAFMDAGKEMNYSTTGDYNGKKRTGFSYFQSNIKNGERWSMNRAYLHRAKNRKNLYLTSNSHVEKILIDPITRVAHGVRFSKFGVMYDVKPRKEIILSAGALNSPKILMLSGIGPADHLFSLGVNVIRDAPVGENLMDHIGYAGLIFKVNNSNTQNDPPNLLNPKNPALSEFVYNRTGPFVIAGLEALAYINVDSLNPNDENPNIELLFGVSEGIHGSASKLQLDLAQKMMSDKFKSSTWNVMPMLMYPKSRGKVLLRSTNPYDEPIIDPNYLNDPEDVKTFIKGMRFIMKLSKTNAFQKYGSEYYNLPLPCNYSFDSDKYWECGARAYTATAYHPSGTCRMGKEIDNRSVVNSNLQVIGIRKLRVADASIMPVIVSAHTNIPVTAIAEKISDTIKKSWYPFNS